VIDKSFEVPDGLGAAVVAWFYGFEMRHGHLGDRKINLYPTFDSARDL